MSENVAEQAKQPVSHEQQKRLEASHEKLLRATNEELKQAGQHGEAIQKAMEQSAKAELAAVTNNENPIEALNAAEATSQSAAAANIKPDKQLRAIAQRRQLKEVQRKLPAAERALSKVIHQPVVRAVSENASKSVSRPSGLLGGGIVAFLGSCGYLYMTKHIGLRYNYVIFFLLFVVGFVLGLLLELVVWSLTASKRQQQ